MTDAEIQRLINIYDDSSNDCCDDHVVLMAHDYLALKAAVRLVHGEPQHGGMFMAICKAKEIIETVAKEQEPTHAE